MIDPNQYQFMKTITATYQQSTATVMHKVGEESTCKNTIRQITKLTGSPKNNKHNTYVEEEQNVNKSVIHGYQDRLDFTNPHNPLEKTVKYKNQAVKMVGRTFELYLGVWLSFTKSKGPLVDTTRITLGEKIKTFQTSIKCFKKSKLVQIEQ